MHVCLLTNRPWTDVPALAVTVAALERAGNSIIEVRVVSPGQPMPGFVIAVPSRIPRGRGKLGALLRRIQPRAWRERNLERRLAGVAATTQADLYLPGATNLVGAAAAAAAATGGAVMRTPSQPDTGPVDLVHLAPHHPAMSRPPAGAGVFHTPDDPRTPYTPEAGRFAGRKVVIAYRKTDSNPGKYLESALRRSGAEVRLETDSLDFDSVDPSTDFVIFVEGPYPAIEVEGATPDFPILFWFHHGEHHLHANLRLADRYRADAVLMAHSWHLCHWVQAPVHRFPFGIPTDLLDPSKPLAERRYDVAMVGAKLWGGGPYGSRQALVARLEEEFPRDRLGFAEKVSAAEMGRLYEEARIIPNEGGTRHYPITMRVFEAVGAGAVLVTDDLPGTDLIFEPGRHYVVLGEDIAAQSRELLEDLDAMQEMTDAALDHARGLHTYDHRVDELFEIAANTRKREIAPGPALSPMAALIDRDAEVQRVAQVGLDGLSAELADRQVFEAARLSPASLGPGKMETVAINADDVSALTDLMRAARRYLYLEGAATGLAEYLAAEQPQAVLEHRDGLIRVDLMAESYRVHPHETIQDSPAP